MHQHVTREDVSREQAVATIRELATLIEQGRVARGPIVALVPDQVRLKIELEDNEVEFRIRWRK